MTVETVTSQTNNWPEFFEHPQLEVDRLVLSSRVKLSHNLYRLLVEYCAPSFNGGIFLHQTKEDVFRSWAKNRLSGLEGEGLQTAWNVANVDCVVMTNTLFRALESVDGVALARALPGVEKLFERLAKLPGNEHMTRSDLLDQMLRFLPLPVQTVSPEPEKAKRESYWPKRLIDAAVSFKEDGKLTFPNYKSVWEVASSERVEGKDVSTARKIRVTANSAWTQLRTALKETASKVGREGMVALYPQTGKFFEVLSAHPSYKDKPFSVWMNVLLRWEPDGVLVEVSDKSRRTFVGTPRTTRRKNEASILTTTESKDLEPNDDDMLLDAPELEELADSMAALEVSEASLAPAHSGSMSSQPARQVVPTLRFATETIFKKHPLALSRSERNWLVKSVLEQPPRVFKDAGIPEWKIPTNTNRLRLGQAMDRWDIRESPDEKDQALHELKQKILLVFESGQQQVLRDTNKGLWIGEVLDLIFEIKDRDKFSDFIERVVEIADRSELGPVTVRPEWSSQFNPTPPKSQIVKV